MEYEAGEYRKLAVKAFPPRSLRETAEGKYWKRFKAPLFAKQFGPVTHVDFCPTYPHHFAVTASTRVIIYDGLTRQVRRTIGRFKDVAFSGTFRPDGRLLVAGGQTGIVQVFDANSRSVLRQLKGHQRPVHVARFAADKVHVLSGSDDVTLRWWDISAGKQLARLTGHEDYVRAAAASPSSADVWASGGYDHTVRLWDVRTRGCALSLDHGAPVEDVAFFPAGGLLVSAGGTSLCVWDVMGGGRLLRRLPNFQKTVSCVSLSPRAGPDAAAAPRLLAGSLDGHVKVFELDNFKVTAASKYPAPVTALGLSADCGLLAVGMADGMLSVRRHAKPRGAGGGGAAVGAGGGGRAGRRARPPRLNAANFRFFLRGRDAKAAASDVVVAARRRARLAPYDRALRAFRYRDALDAALATARPDVVHSMLEELAARGGLHGALAGRPAAGLLPLLRHLARWIADPRHAASLAGVASRVVDIYAPVVHTNAEVDACLRQLRDALAEEVRLQEALMRLSGCLEPILAGALAAPAAAGR
ncbi:utp15 [Scenedesmus sp. PABB004]|nr:utp15 [Scenedesmus sp. PABB004]